MNKKRIKRLRRKLRKQQRNREAYESTRRRFEELRRLVFIRSIGQLEFSWPTTYTESSNASAGTGS